MLNPISIMADQLGDYLSNLYLQYFSHRRPEIASYLGGAARLVLERIGNSTALYHNIEHTMSPEQDADPQGCVEPAPPGGLRPVDPAAIQQAVIPHQDAPLEP